MTGAFPRRIAPVWKQQSLILNINSNHVCGYKSLMKTAAHIFKALADETRLRILCLLLWGELRVCDIMLVLQLPQSTVSRHLAYLKNARLVEDRRCGIWMYYTVVVEGNDLHNGLLDYLRENLPTLKVAGEDRERLTGFRRHNLCD